MPNETFLFAVNPNVKLRGGIGNISPSGRGTTKLPPTPIPEFHPLFIDMKDGIGMIVPFLFIFTSICAPKSDCFSSFSVRESDKIGASSSAEFGAGASFSTEILANAKK